MTSLWRKRNVHYNGQNQPKLFKMTAMAGNTQYEAIEQALKERNNA
jgi:hypothetical protein